MLHITNNVIIEEFNIRRPTSKDVARLAGVSQPTVSRAFLPDGGVAPATRDRIEAAAKALGYTPNMTARLLQANRSRIAAIIVRRVSTFETASLIDALILELNKITWQALIVRMEGSDSPLDAIGRMVSQGIDAIITDLELPEDHQSPLPLIRIGSGRPAGTSVMIDENAVGGDAAQLLVELGSERLLIVAGSEQHERVRSFLDTCRANKREGRAVSCDLAMPPLQLFEQIRAHLPDEDGVFLPSDVLAVLVGSYRRARLGQAHRAHTHLIGFGNDTLSADPFFPFSTFDPGWRRLARAACAILNGRSKSRNIMMRAELIRHQT